MSEKIALTTEQVEKVAGGGCTPEQYIGILEDLTGAYESLIQFTSYVMERVSK